MCVRGHVEGHVLVMLIMRRQGISFGSLNSMFMSIWSLLVQNQSSGNEVLAGSPHVHAELLSI